MYTHVCVYMRVAARMHACNKKIIWNFYLIKLISILLFRRYNVHWYMAPIRIQKMILFLLQKGTKSFHLILGGIFVASMQSAASVRDIYKYISRYII